MVCEGSGSISSHHYIYSQWREKQNVSINDRKYAGHVSFLYRPYGKTPIPILPMLRNDKHQLASEIAGSRAVTGCAEYHYQSKCQKERYSNYHLIYGSRCISAFSLPVELSTTDVSLIYKSPSICSLSLL